MNTSTYVAGRRKNMAVLPLLDAAIEDLQASGVTRFTSPDLVEAASKKLPEHGRGPAEIARLVKGVKNLVQAGRLQAVDTRKVPGINRPLSVYEEASLCPLAGADLSASMMAWNQEVANHGAD
jgi:hypothetical protein